MGRRKVRHYRPREYYKDLFEEYFNKNTPMLVQYTAEKLGFESPSVMRDEEMTGVWFDCGWCIITPKNKEQYREWLLDNDRISAHLYVDNRYYSTQSTTIKEIMVRKALEDLGLADEFYVDTRLD